MMFGEYFVAMTVTPDEKIWEDVYFKSEEKALEAAEELAEVYGGIAVVEKVEF